MMSDYCAIVVVVLLLAASPAVWSANNLCQPDPLDPCSAYCYRGTIGKLTIRNALQYPVVIQDGKYEYTFDPCSGATCGFVSTSTNNAVCQTDPQSVNNNAYSLGKIPGAIWNLTSSDPLTFNIIYPGGDSTNNNINRSSNITFTVGSTSTFTFVSENEVTAQYLFTVQAPASSYTVEDGGHGVPGFLVFIVLGLVVICCSVCCITGCVLICVMIAKTTNKKRGYNRINA